MENLYGIGVRNRYDLFYDDEVDPLEILKQQEEEKERKKLQPKEKTKITKNTKDRTVAPASSQIPKKVKDVLPAAGPKSAEFMESTKTKARPSEKPPRTYLGNTANRNDNQLSSPDESSIVTDQREKSENEFRRGGRGGFRFRGRGGRGRGSFFGENRKRDFNAQSGGTNKTVPENTSISEKWDEPVDVFEHSSERKEASGDWSSEPKYQPENISGTDNIESKENVPIIASEETVDEAVREMTLDEWKREQEGKRAVPKFNLRKPGEGEDNNQWKKLYILKKKVKDHEENYEEEDADDEEAERRGRQRQLVDIQIDFNYSRRGRGRGGSRGTGPRSGGIAREDNRGRDAGLPRSGGLNRLNRGQPKPSKIQDTQSAPRVDDWNDFPSLIAM